MIRFLGLTIAIAIAVSGISRAETGSEQYLEIGESCVKAREPGVCMEAYGFQCHRGRMPDKSIEAHMLGCNLDLADGRYHFVQMLYDNGGWIVETERTYLAEYSEVESPEEDPGLALSAYIRHEMKDYSMHSSGGGSVGLNMPQSIETGARRKNGHIVVRAVCGVVFDGQLDESVSMLAKSNCERRLLRTIKKLSQPQAAGPFRVAAASEIEWESRFATLVSSNTAHIVDGHYTFTEKHAPCLWISDCCSENGAIYLDSCRAPNDSELQTIDACLAEGSHRGSEAFLGCLRAAGVKAGCEEQADGARICY